jgi:hypothetical protein
MSTQDNQHRRTVEVSRPPTPGEIRFGYGCRHYATVPAEMVKGRRYITINGNRYTVPR